ncbi:chromo domain-containing protein, partial [Ferroplasma sp.]|uniref:chromo domain-containing protein n=1 Tax=Ferroplasma sp. TaxID=2591003 RepID=UPI00261864BC
SSINNNKIIDKKYYDNDLQYIPNKIENKVEKVEKFEISKILDFKRKNGKDYYLIKWKGYNKPIWQIYDTLIQDVPKLISKYDREHDITH